ncbi:MULTISPECIES: hypothetical protein [unclassified Nocardia]|uniref:hypothetical protein n=1 Tax=unclassified Nocardia TaxID=2637762 RepID=UPI001CE4A1A8|nr:MULTISPECIES: hypothetical protein [unclassified Nocardia]
MRIRKITWVITVAVGAAVIPATSQASPTVPGRPVDPDPPCGVSMETDHQDGFYVYWKTCPPTDSVTVIPLWYHGAENDWYANVRDVDGKDFCKTIPQGQWDFWHVTKALMPRAGDIDPAELTLNVTTCLPVPDTRKR